MKLRDSRSASHLSRLLSGTVAERHIQLCRDHQSSARRQESPQCRCYFSAFPKNAPTYLTYMPTGRGLLKNTKPIHLLPADGSLPDGSYLPDNGPDMDTTRGVEVARSVLVLLSAAAVPSFLILEFWKSFKQFGMD